MLVVLGSSRDKKGRTQVGLKSPFILTLFLNFYIYMTYEIRFTPDGVLKSRKKKDHILFLIINSRIHLQKSENSHGLVATCSS